MHLANHLSIFVFLILVVILTKAQHANGQQDSRTQRINMELQKLLDEEARIQELKQKLRAQLSQQEVDESWKSSTNRPITITTTRKPFPKFHSNPKFVMESNQGQMQNNDQPIAPFAEIELESSGILILDKAAYNARRSKLIRV